MKFEWDEEKNRKNVERHGIGFEEALGVFFDEHRIERFDFEHSWDEDRWQVLGMVGDILFVVYTERGENIRLISARKATEKEEKIYVDGLLSDK